MNVVLLVNLAGSAILYARFLRGRGAFPRLWRWQMVYLYVIAGWTALVAFGFPVVFGFEQARGPTPASGCRRVDPGRRTDAPGSSGRG